MYPSPRERERNRKPSMKPQPFDFDLVSLVANYGADGVSIDRLAIDARQITGRDDISAVTVRAALGPLLRRGAVQITADGRVRLK